MYHRPVDSGGQIKAFGMDLNLKLFSAPQFMAHADPVRYLRTRRGRSAVLPDGADQQPQRQDGYEDARPTVGDAAVPAATFRILLHGDPSSRGVVHDYFDNHSHNYSNAHVPGRPDGSASRRTKKLPTASQTEASCSPRYPRDRRHQAGCRRRRSLRSPSRRSDPRRNPRPINRNHSLAPKRSVNERRVNPWTG